MEVLSGPKVAVLGVGAEDSKLLDSSIQVRITINSNPKNVLVMLGLANKPLLEPVSISQVQIVDSEAISAHVPEDDLVDGLAFREAAADFVVEVGDVVVVVEGLGDAAVGVEGPEGVVGEFVPVAEGVGADVEADFFEEGGGGGGQGGEGEEVEFHVDNFCVFFCIKFLVLHQKLQSYGY